MNRDRLFPVTTGLAGVLVLVTLYWAFFRAPFESVMGAAQKIFYFHVPAAYGMYLGAITCLIGSAAYLYKPSDGKDALARAGGEVAVCFGMMVLTTGPIWARPIWGVYWTWEPRLMTSLLSVMIYVAYVVLRGFAGDGEGERKFAAALGVLGAANLPIIHYAVQMWGGNHPRVVSSGGGGLRHPDMKIAFALGMTAFTVLAIVLVWSRLRVHLAVSRLARAEEDAVALGLVAEEGLSHHATVEPPVHPQAPADRDAEDRLRCRRRAAEWSRCWTDGQLRLHGRGLLGPLGRPRRVPRDDLAQTARARQAARVARERHRQGPERG